MLLNDAYMGQDSVEAQGVIVERFRNVGDAAGAQDVKGKAAHAGKDAGVMTNAAAVFTKAHITHIMLAILDAPVPANRLSIALGPDGRRAVAGIIGQLLGLAPLATLRVELVACAPHLDDGGNQPVPFGRQGSSGEDSHLTPFDALALMIKLPMSAECRSPGL